jgi:tRNA-uridine 2-sulfurtransferase
MSGRALVAMSGGVDSSVAAALMLEDGWDAVGVTLKQWEEADGSLPTTGCCTVADAEDARRVSAQLGMPHYVLDYVARFRGEVVDRFGADYAAGRTPNPCIECNRRVRFDALLTRTAELGCDVLVTGHHARVRRDGDRYRLLKAVDGSKDQSYVLHMLGQSQLASIRLPVGEMTKDEVRKRAAALGLRTATKADSQDLCFVGAGGYRSFIRRHFPDAARPGPIVDHDGSVLGRHDGTVDFTIGQRKGIGVAVGEPRYVVEVQPGTATVVVGRKEDLLVDGCRVEDVSFVAGEPPSPLEIDVKVRYRSSPEPARIVGDGAGWSVWFDRPMGGVAPGQAAVFYRDDEVVGGGTIAAPLRR